MELEASSGSWKWINFDIYDRASIKCFNCVPLAAQQQHAECCKFKGRDREREVEIVQSVGHVSAQCALELTYRWYIYNIRIWYIHL